MDCWTISVDLRNKSDELFDIYKGQVVGLDIGWEREPALPIEEVALWVVFRQNLRHGFVVDVFKPRNNGWEISKKNVYISTNAIRGVWPTSGAAPDEEV